MASPLPSEVVEPTFLPFFGMERAPFLNLSAPTEMFQTDQSALLKSHLAAATRRADSLVVIFGADGVGKTTLLNEYIAGLGDEVCYAAFDETCVEGIQFYRSFLEQIGLGEIVGTLRELQHITSEYLVHRGKNGGHALIFVDNAHLVRPAVLEQLRWIADIKIDYMRAFSMVLAGGLKFQRIMESPAMRSLRFRYQTNFHVRALTEAETRDYVRHRLNLAGGADAVKFPDESLALIYRFTGGNPGMINTLCHAVLAESCAQGTRVITEQRVRSLAEAGKMPPHVVPIRGKGRRKTDPEPSLSAPGVDSGERMAGRQHDAALPAGESSRAPLHHDVEIRELLVRITELSSQLERKASEEKRRALMDARKHDKDVGELREQLAAQAELAAGHSRALDDRARDVARLNAALLDSHKNAERLAIRQEQYDRQIGGLTQALAESEAALADRDATIAGLAAELSRLQTTAAGSAAEIVRLEEALSGSRNAPPRGGKASREAITDRKKQRRSARRARAMQRDAGPDAGATGTSRTETLLPGQMNSVPAIECTTVTANGYATMIELFLDGKPWKVVDLVGKPRRMMVGRAEDCDVRLDSKYVSRHHAIIVTKEGSVAIEDLRSSNGIFVNAQKVDQSELRPGDTVAIGNFWLRLKGV
ncbi:MAG TPA: FHA domain-containing protein [Steroidobacteraceae bacterium]|nr:FHA domain-containing protein [Steroidobacteraceae bacterium]